MANHKTIHPVPGRLIRDPVTGREITEPTVINGDDPFWIRRLADGDVSGQAPVPDAPAESEARALSAVEGPKKGAK
jgi:hypothetical protein